MFNRRLRNNIKQLDLQINTINEEISKIEVDSTYENYMEKLDTLVKIRTQYAQKVDEEGFTNTQMRALEELDSQIEHLLAESNIYKTSTYEDKIRKLKDLTELRCKLVESYNKDRIQVTPELVSGVVGLTSILLVLRYEKYDVVTTKAMGIVNKFIRG